MRDLRFIAGNFLWEDIPPDKEFYSAYFDSELERKFLSYYLLFNSLYDEGFFRFWQNFMDHTGFRCTTRWVQKLRSRYHKIEAELAKAKAAMDLAMVAKIRGGEYFMLREIQRPSRSRSPDRH